MRMITNLRWTIFALTLLCLPTQSNAGTISFETRPDGTTPTDNTELLSSYADGSTLLTFGFDTNGDFNIDINARFEKRGSDSIFAYNTSLGDDADKTGISEGGDWLLRTPQASEPSGQLVISQGVSFLVKYSGSLPSNISGQVWDVDSGEQYKIEVFDALGALIDSTLSFVGTGGCCDGPTDGLPFTYSFSNLGAPAAIVKITEVQGIRFAGFGFDNISTLASPTPVPEPSSALLFLSGVVACCVLLRRRKRFLLYALASRCSTSSS